MDRQTGAKTGYTVSYRNIRHPRLEFKTGTLLIVLPKGSKGSARMLEKYENWIKERRSIIEVALRKAKGKHLNMNRTERKLRELVYTVVGDFQVQLHTTIHRTYFRLMKTKWASHSANGNLTVNTLMKYLPKTLVQYIVYHELTHSLERRHNERFWNIIRREFADYEAKEEDLLTYWFLVKQKEKRELETRR